MEKQALIKQLIAAGWSDRKIHGSTGLNRRTVSSYRKKFKKELEAESVNASQENGCESTSSGEALSVQNAPEKCPPKEGGSLKCPMFNDIVKRFGRQLKFPL